MKLFLELIMYYSILVMQDADNANKYTAEAKFLRAFAYFNLVRLYGAVPLVTRVVTSDEKELLFTRVAECSIFMNKLF